MPRFVFLRQVDDDSFPGPAARGLDDGDGIVAIISQQARAIIAAAALAVAATAVQAQRAGAQHQDEWPSANFFLEEQYRFTASTIPQNVPPCGFWTDQDYSGPAVRALDDDQFWTTPRQIRADPPAVQGFADADNVFVAAAAFPDEDYFVAPQTIVPPRLAVPAVSADEDYPGPASRAIDDELCLPPFVWPNVRPTPQGFFDSDDVIVPQPPSLTVDDDAGYTTGASRQYDTWMVAPWVFGSGDEAIPTIQDEDYFVAPQAIVGPRSATPAFSTDEDYPGPASRALDDELCLPPFVWPNARPTPQGFFDADDVIVPQPAAFCPDEDYPGAPQIRSARTTPQGFFDPDDVIVPQPPTLAVDEDIFVAPRPIAQLPTPNLGVLAGDDVVPQPTTFCPDEDYALSAKAIRTPPPFGASALQPLFDSERRFLFLFRVGDTWLTSNERTALLTANERTAVLTASERTAVLTSNERTAVLTPAERTAILTPGT